MNTVVTPNQCCSQLNTRAASAPLKHLVQIRKAGQLQDTGVLGSTLRRHEQRTEGRVDHVFHSPLPAVSRLFARARYVTLTFLVALGDGVGVQVLLDGVEVTEFFGEGGEALFLRVPRDLMFRA